MKSCPLQKELKIKQVKTKQEILYLQKAACLTDKAFSQIANSLKKRKFKTENDIKLFLKRFAQKNNTKLSFSPIIASGKNTKNPHHKTSNKKLTKGFLLIDFGVSYKNYCSDMTRMFYLGRPRKKELKLYLFLLKIQRQAIKNLKLNQTFKGIEKQARKSLGHYSSYFIHRLGHGLGRKVHQAPSFKNNYPLRKNQVFTIEPGLYFKNFGLRIEDTILMKDKPFLLTKTKKELIIIPL